MMHCLNCGKGGKLEKIGKNRLTRSDIVRCKSCGLSFTLGDDAQIKRKLKEFYKKDYWHPQEGQREFAGIVDYVRRMVIFLGVPPLINVCHGHMLREHAPDGRLLDIGAGRGDAMRYFRSRGYKVEGIEPDVALAKKINERWGSIVCRADDAETAKIEGRYDVIYMCHVLEHLVSPPGFLKKVRSHLKRKGVLFIEVPNCESPSELKTSTGMESHIFHFTKSSLEKLVRSAGYDLLHSGVYDVTASNQLSSFFKALLRLDSYEVSKPTKGRKLVLIASPSA